jgi:acetyltransferase-like isoleucine patch superfamily enzyme
MATPKRRSVGIVGVSFGERVTVIEPANLYGCSIGDDSFIGPFVEVQRGAVIGRRTRVQSHSFVCDMVVIGDDCFVGHGVMFVNDDFRSGGPAGDPDGWSSTHIGDRVSIGSNATMMPVTVADDVVIGAGSVVTHDLTEAGVYAGNPARLLQRRSDGD